MTLLLVILLLVILMLLVILGTDGSNGVLTVVEGVEILLIGGTLIDDGMLAGGGMYKGGRGDAPTDVTGLAEVTVGSASDFAKSADMAALPVLGWEDINGSGGLLLPLLLP